MGVGWQEGGREGEGEGWSGLGGRRGKIASKCDYAVPSKKERRS